LDIHLAEGIGLLGYDLYIARDAPEIAVPRVGLFLYWQATQPVSHSYKVFVHVMDATGQLAAQDDSVPVLWTYPTNDWHEGEVIIDFHNMVLPALVTPNTYTLQVGMYDEQTMQRLTIISPDGLSMDDRVTLTQLSLAPVE
jgi:hypothetical protein